MTDKEDGMDAKKEEILSSIKTHLEGRGIEGSKVSPEASLVDDLDLDSLDTVELTLHLEETYGIEIPDSDLEQLATVGDALELIERKLAVQA